MFPFATLRHTLWTMRQFRTARARPEHIRKLQEARFRALVRHAVMHSAFYREKYRGIDTERCAITELPPVTKRELMANFDRVVTDPTVTRAALERFIDDPANVGELFLGQYPVCHTSGSQGQPMLVVQDQLVLDLLFAFQMTRGNVGYHRLGVLEAFTRLFAPARIAVIISKPGFYPSAWAWRHLPRAMKPFVRLLFLPRNDPDLIAKLNTFRPTTLSSTVATLDGLTLERDRLRLPSLRQIVSSSEVLTDAARARIAAAFKVPILDTYGCGECIYLGTGCPTHAGTHVNADWAILEVVDEANRSVPDGTTGNKALLTNLANFVQPLIRYEVGDRLTMATEPCACGSQLPRIARIDGRSSDAFWVLTATGFRPLGPYPLQHAFEYLRDVREWQATQIDRNRIVVRFEMLPGTTFDAVKARARLMERLALAGFGDELDISFEVVPQLAADAGTGKFRRMVSLVGPPTDMPRPAPQPASPVCTSPHTCSQPV